MNINIPRFLKNSLLSILVIFIILLLVKVFSFTPESGFAFMQRPDKIAIDGKGNIYVLSSMSGTTWKYDQKGNLKFRLKHSLMETAKGFVPRNITAVNNKIYVADTFGKKVGLLDHEGKVKNIVVLQSETIGSFSVDNKGNIYVTESLKNKVLKLDSKGRLIMQIGGTGPGKGYNNLPDGSGSDEGQFRNPRWITVDSVANIYVADAKNYRIQKFDSNGNFLSAVKTGGNFYLQNVCVDQDGNLYVSDLFSISKFTLDGNKTYSIDLGKENKQIMDICVGPDNNLYVFASSSLVNGGNTLRKYSLDGNLITSMELPKKKDMPNVLAIVTNIKHILIYGVSSIFAVYAASFSLSWLLYAIIVSICFSVYAYFDGRRRFSKILPVIIWIVIVIITGLLGFICYLNFRNKGDFWPCEKCGKKKLINLKRCPFCGQAKLKKMEVLGQRSLRSPRAL